MTDTTTPEEKTIQSLFTADGQLRHNTVKVNGSPMQTPPLPLFDADGFASTAMRSAIRSRMMYKTPLAHTDLARLFYSIVAQETYDVPAGKMYG
jgi:hypothetical protein